MLKDKSCYSNDRVYAMNYFFHKADVADYCIDPLLGSFVRVVYPPKDMPAGGNDIYNRPQFMFMTRSDRSRLYELKEARPLVDAVYNLLQSAKAEHPVYLQMEVAGKLEVDENGGVSFKDTDMRFQRLLSYPPRPNWDRGVNNEHLTKERYIQGLEYLLHGLKCALAGEGEPRDLITMGNEMMMTLKRPDTRVSFPVVVTARKFAERKDAYIVVHSNNQRIVFPADKAEDMIERYFTFIEEIGQRLTRTGKINDGEVKFIYAKPGIIDENMEYVNMRMVDFVGGAGVHVMMNSDRYPGNTKFSFIYDHQFVTEMRTHLTAFARSFERICAE
uniref:Uncharacterized protein n=1 Tax=Pantoea phage Survivor TaxID=3232176 RepID=A0AAU8L103_9CAUD